MNIRALTGFLDPGWPLDPQHIARLAEGLKSVRTRLRDAGYQIQTLRLATPPPVELETPVPIKDRLDFAKQLEAECFVQGIDYSAVGPALPSEREGFEVIPNILRATEAVFCSGIFAEPEAGLSLSAAAACAKVIKRTSVISPDGFANLRFAALANVASGSPFFPAAYHRGGPPALAIAIEAAELAVDAFKDGGSLSTVGRLFTETVEGHAGVIARLARSVATDFELRFLGLDFSLAPFPEQARSLGTALENFGVASVGLAGSVAAASFLADCLDRAQFPRTGFCGLFFPVLEDAVLASRNQEGLISLADLLLYSTVCGTGLDTVPLAGDTREQSLQALLVDIGALALRHDKQLTARLMPIPGKEAGEKIQFSFPYFADSCVMELKSSALGGLLGGEGNLTIQPRGTL
jgi:hypothetical protein